MVGTVCCSVVDSATSAPAAGRGWCSVLGPVLPNLPVFDRGKEPWAGTLVNSLGLALPTAGDTHAPDVSLETDPDEEAFLARLQPGGFNRLFLSPDLGGTESNRLPWTKWLPLVGKLAVSRAMPGWSGGASLQGSFPFRVFVLDALVGSSFLSFSVAEWRLFPLTDDGARGSCSLLGTLFCATAWLGGWAAPGCPDQGRDECSGLCDWTRPTWAAELGRVGRRASIMEGWLSKSSGPTKGLSDR